MTAYARLLVLPLLLLFCSCAGSGGGSLFSQPDPDKRYYALQAQRNEKACAHGFEKVLKIRRSNIAPTYSSRELVYKTGANEYKTDYYNLFLVSPQDMLSEAVLEWFSGSGLFAHVVPGTSALRPDYILESSITRLYGDFSAKQQPKAILEMQFFLLQDVLAQYNVVFCKDYVQEIALESPTPESLVAGLEKGLTIILAQVEDDVAQSVGSRD